MKPEKDRQMDKVSYEKPTAIELGAAAPIVGMSCVEGLAVLGGQCENVGNSATTNCSGVGNSPGGWCQIGNGDIPQINP